MTQIEQSNIENHILSRYNIIKKIGSGAYGHVWKVQDKQTKNIYALKKIFDAFQHSTDAQRTYRQIQILKQIDHPNIIKLYQTFKAQNNKDVYLIFQYMEADLHNVIAQGILKEVHVRFIIYQLAKALKFLHSGSIIHRDLKPSNILINSNCCIKLCDFGLVRSFANHNQSTPILTEGVATRWYRAPQVLLGSTSYSTPADIWSFGCIIYEILLQKPMFPGDTTSDQIHKILAYSGYPTEDQIKSLQSSVVKSMLKQSKLINYTPNQKQLLKDIPPLFAQLIKKMTIFNPKQRITIQQILNNEVVQPFRKKQQQKQCTKIIMTQINDNKKLTVEEYRRLIYCTKRSHSSSTGETKNQIGNKKSASYTRFTSQTEPNQGHGIDKEREKIGLKYVRSVKDIMKTNLPYNKSAADIHASNQFTKDNKDNNKDKEKDKEITKEKDKKIQQKTADSRKDSLKDHHKDPIKEKESLIDPSRITYISKTSYTPKYLDQKNYSSINQNSLNNNNNIAHNNAHTHIHNNNYASINHSAVGNQPHNSKVGTYYTSTSSYANQKKPTLFKSSKYIINKTEENHKDEK